MKKILFVVIVSILLLHKERSCFGQTTQTKQDSISLKNESSFPNSIEKYDVSLIRLIANPEKYHGKPMRIIGFLNLEFEGDAIYLHKEDFDYSITENALWVDISGEFLKTLKLSDYKRKYVIIEGTFDMYRQGHRDLFGGTIKNITRLDVWDLRR